MPSKELLGSSDAFYFKTLPKINPRLNELKRRNPKAYDRHVKRLLPVDSTSKIDEDIDAIARDLMHRVGARLETEKIEKIPERGFVPYKEPTGYGLLLENLNRAYRHGVQDGFFHYGPGITKEMVVMWLLFNLMPKYMAEFTGEFVQIYRHLTLDEIQKVFKVDAYLHKREAKKEGIPFAYDNYRYLVFDEERWFQSFTEEVYGLEPHFGKIGLNAYVAFRAWEEKGKAFKNRLKKKEVPINNWSEVCAWIYIIRGLEEKRRFILRRDPQLRKISRDYKFPLNRLVSAKEYRGALQAIRSSPELLKIVRDCKILRSDRELQKIWGIKRDTYRRRMELIASLDSGSRRN
jgi:hypothetical protein